MSDREPQEGDVQRFRRKGEVKVRVYTGGEWVYASPGDTYEGHPLIPESTDPLPMQQQYVGGIRLIRGWHLVPGDNDLRSLATDFRWKPGIMTSHMLPSLGNSGAGFFGFYKWPYAEQQLGGMVMGTFLGWGRAVRATEGFRTQFAKVEALLDPADQNTAQVQEIADKFGIPMLAKGEIQELKTGLVSLREAMLYPEMEEDDE